MQNERNYKMSNNSPAKKSKTKATTEVVGITAFIVIAAFIIFFLCKTGVYYFNLSKIKNYAVETGLTNVSMNADEYYIQLRCDNFKEIAWDSLMMMDKNIRDVHKNVSIIYKSKSFDYYIWQADNKIIEKDYDTKSEYNGSWESNQRIDVAAEEAARKEQHKRVQEVLDSMKDDAISTSVCGICGKQATKRIDNEYYCSKHYNEAFDWYVKQAAEKLLEGQ